MRKRILAIILVILTAFSLSAGSDYAFDIISFDPIHDVYKADKNSPNLAFNYIVNYKGYPDHVWQEIDNEVHVFPLDFDRFRAKPGLAQLKIGETFTFGRNIFSFDNFLSPIKWDILAVQGIVNIVFDGEISDLIGYDGAYFYGTALSVADRFSLRFGISHWCSHYGDAILKNLTHENRAIFDNNYKYLRNNLTIGISVKPVEWIRLYGEYQWLPKGVFLKPAIFRPDHGKDSVGWGAKGYNAAIANFGIEISYPLWKNHGNTTLAYDLHMYEEGKVIYQDEDGNYLKYPKDFSNPQPGEIYYDKDAPWDFEHSIVLSQDINSYFSLEIGWHTGKSPLHGLFFLRDSQWVHIGMRFDPDLTCHTVR